MSEQGLTIAQAAKALGVSPKTIRRHIKDGKIPYVLVPGKFGEEYRIPLSPPSAPKEVTADSITTEDIPGVDKSTVEKGDATGTANELITTPTLAINIINDLQKTNLQLAAQLGAAQERIHELESQLRLLKAPKEPWWKRVLKALKV